MKSIHLLIAALVATPLLAEDQPRQDEKAGGEPATREAAVKPYPLETCIVSDEKLGEMGKPASFVYQGQEIKLCCKSCRKDFDKDPASFLRKLDELRKK